MNKLSRGIFWVGVFFATVALAVGVSLLAVRVRAAMDARRVNTVELVAQPVSDDRVVLAAQAAGPTPDAGQLPCVSDEDICDGPWGIEPASSAPPVLGAQPQATATPQTYRDCCCVLRVVPTSSAQTAPRSAAPEAEQNTAPSASPEPTAPYLANCH